jgi:hypothetical protein
MLPVSRYKVHIESANFKAFNVPFLTSHRAIAPAWMPSLQSARPRKAYRLRRRRLRFIGRRLAGLQEGLSTCSRSQAPIESMAAPMNSCGTTRWARSFLASPGPNSARIKMAAAWEAPSERTKPSFFGDYEGFTQVQGWKFKGHRINLRSGGNLPAFAGVRPGRKPPRCLREVFR